MGASSSEPGPPTFMNDEKAPNKNTDLPIGPMSKEER